MRLALAYILYLSSKSLLITTTLRSVLVQQVKFSITLKNEKDDCGWISQWFPRIRMIVEINQIAQNNLSLSARRAQPPLAIYSYYIVIWSKLLQLPEWCSSTTLISWCFSWRKECMQLDLAEFQKMRSWSLQGSKAQKPGTCTSYSLGPVQSMGGYH